MTGERERLIEALWMRINDAFASRGMFLPVSDVDHLARHITDVALLPVVERIAAEKAAEELRAASLDPTLPGIFPSTVAWLRDRAAVLAPDGSPSC